MRAMNEPRDRKADIATCVMASWPTIPRWSLPTEGLTPALLAMASPVLLARQTEVHQAAGAVAVAYIQHFSRAHPSPPGGVWWGFRVGTSHEALAASQLYLPVPPVLAISEATVARPEVDARIEILHHGDDWWSTSVIRLDEPLGATVPRHWFAQLLGRSVAAPERMLRFEGIQPIESFLDGYSRFLGQYSW